MENRHIEGVREAFVIILYGAFNGLLLKDSTQGPIGIVGNILWTLVEVVIYLHISNMDRYRTEKCKIATKIGISPSDPRLSKVISEIKPYAWSHINSVRILNKLLKTSEKFKEEHDKPYDVELDDKIYK